MPVKLFQAVVDQQLSMTIFQVLADSGIDEVDHRSVQFQPRWDEQVFTPPFRHYGSGDKNSSGAA